MVIDHWKPRGLCKELETPCSWKKIKPSGDPAVSHLVTYSTLRCHQTWWKMEAMDHWFINWIGDFLRASPFLWDFPATFDDTGGYSCKPGDFTPTTKKKQRSRTILTSFYPSQFMSHRWLGDLSQESMAQWPCNSNRLIGGTYHIYSWPVFDAYVKEYPHKLWPSIWY